MSTRLAIVPLGLSLSAFGVISYVLCILFGILVSERGMHQLRPQLLPWFTWNYLGRASSSASSGVSSAAGTSP